MLAMNYVGLNNELTETGVKLVAVSKTHPIEIINDLYTYGQRDFGENKVQELIEKAQTLPEDIRWHMIGHLQRNKVKMLLPHVYMIHSIDSIRLLKEVDKEAGKINRKVKCLLQAKIAQEDTKYGFDFSVLRSFFQSGTHLNYPNIIYSGLMGMATNTSDQSQVKAEFASLKVLFGEIKANHFTDNDSFKEISMGMSGDYKLAVESGSTIVRIGSLIFGDRYYAKNTLVYKR